MKIFQNGSYTTYDVERNDYLRQKIANEATDPPILMICLQRTIKPGFVLLAYLELVTVIPHNPNCKVSSHYRTFTRGIQSGCTWQTFNQSLIIGDSFDDLWQTIQTKVDALDNPIGADKDSLPGLAVDNGIDGYPYDNCH